MDLHPLLIHFPIAFLTTYAVFELLRFKSLLEWPHWFAVKGALVAIGELGAIATLIAALMSEALQGGSRLSDMYKLFMTDTAVIFGVITIIYLRRWTNPKVLVPLALIGLFFIVVAGGLFGATIYGTRYDPYLAPVFKLLDVY